QARYSQEFVEDLRKLDAPAKEIAVKVIRKILERPDSNKRLTGPLAGCLRERFLKYRIIYRINEHEGFVELIKLKKRDAAYR
ncbi:MAG: type II toxin-antitoxin system RelE/ParE family toxin, partial [Candidatus Micrarchaeota archaeon]